MTRGAIAVVALLVGACGGARTRGATLVTDQACALVPTPPSSAESVAVVLTSSLDPTNVPRATSVAERFVFTHAYETLVRVDCLRRPTSGLAKSWTSLDGNSRSRIVLRTDARFWNGDAVTARDVLASWRATAASTSAAVARRFADASTVVDDTTLDIAISELSPITLGDPELAVVRRSPQTRWPEGTGAYRIAARGSTLVLEPVSGTTGPRLTIQSVSESDARDRIDAGVDLLLTESPSLVTYATTRGDVASMPLAWYRTWVIVTPRRAPPAPHSGLATDAIMARTLAFRGALARDAVRADARPAEPPFWWSDIGSCSTSQAAPPARGTSRVAYSRDEPVARALAERLVALAASPRSANGDSALSLLAPPLAEAGARATTIGLEPSALASALRDGSELAFIVPIDRASLAGCVDVRGWVAPLIDTRLTAVVRRDRLGLTMTWDSTVAISTSRAAARP